ncbi:hypothetical protein LTS15_003251 [Exophiala xenobiotica]|nr:hypothetical protein LTS15_003251 [Exophiala xenobiotica]
MKFLTSILLFYLTIFSPAVLARSWRPGDPCPTFLRTTVPGGNPRGTPYYDEGEDLEEHLAQQPHALGGEWDLQRPIFPSMTSVHSALTSCPNITTLNLRAAMLGCTERPDRWNLPFPLSSTEHYPSLRTLRLDGYRGFTDRPYDETSLLSQRHLGLPWYEKAAQWILSGSAFQHLHDSLAVPESQRKKTNLDLWLDAMDFSSLQTLALSDIRASEKDYFFTKTAPHLTSLKHLEVEGGPVSSTLDFLQTLADHNISLSHLAWTDLHPSDFSNTNSSIISTILATHGSSLQHLDLHTVETLHRPSPSIPVSQLNTFQTLPNLSHLSLNLPRNQTWPFDMLVSLSSIPSLTTLDLWLDLASECRRQLPDRGYRDYGHLTGDNPTLGTWLAECTGSNQYLLPHLNEITATEVFHFLRQNKVGMPLTNATFWAGDWSRPWGGPLYSPPWIEHRQAKVVCGGVVTPSNSDSDGAEREGTGLCEVEVGKQYWEGRRGWEDY